MTVHKINNRVPHVALQATNPGSAKKKESFSWQRPLLYTALAVAGAAAILYKANRWGFSPTPKLRSWHCVLPQQGVKPNPDMLVAKYKLKLWCLGCWTGINLENPEPIAAPWTAHSPQMEAILKRIDQIATLEELDNFLKSITPKDIPKEFIYESPSD